VKRQFRLRRSKDIKRVRRSGKAFAHPLIVLVTQPSVNPGIRASVITNRHIGNAVKRNLYRRRIQSCLNQILPKIQQSCDMVILARQPIQNADIHQINQALLDVLARAKILPRDESHV